MGPLGYGRNDALQAAPLLLLPSWRGGGDIFIDKAAISDRGG